MAGPTVLLLLQRIHLTLVLEGITDVVHHNINHT